jgi:hypothetical protein
MDRLTLTCAGCQQEVLAYMASFTLALKASDLGLETADSLLPGGPPQ